MSERMAPVENGVRAHRSASGVYLHAADLAHLLRSQTEKVDVITALVLPNIALLIERLSIECAERGKP